MAKKNRIKITASTGEILHKLRKKSKLTQEEMAARLGVVEWLYNRYEKDIEPFPVELLDRIVDAKDLHQEFLRIFTTAAHVDNINRRLDEMPEEKRAKAYQDIFDRIEDYMIEKTTEQLKEESNNNDER